MAAPVKNLLDPSSLTIVLNSVVPLPKMPWRDLEYASKLAIIVPHSDYIVPRWTIALLQDNNSPVVTIKSLPLPIITARTNPGRIAQIITFPSVYKQQGSGSTRPSIGQQWPRGVK